MDRPLCRARPGFTVTELAITGAVYGVLALTVGVVLSSGTKAWQRTYAAANSPAKEDATVATLAFSSMGRRANRLAYVLYEGDASYLRPVEAKGGKSQEVVWGDAVEFRYWAEPLDEADSHKLLDVTRKATAYALFYIEDQTLKVDYGPYPPGAAPEGGGAKNAFGVKTRVLAEHVTTEAGRRPFSHTAVNKTGQGSVRINVLMTDPATGTTVKLTTATLLRNIWPR